MPLTQKQIEHIAGLARIKLTAAEKEKMIEELGEILGYVGKLNQIKTENVEPLAQVAGLENVLRQDRLASAETSAGKTGETEKLTAQFPRRKENYLKVRQVFGNND